MNRIVNNPDFVVEDMLKGFVKTHKDIVSTTEDARVLKYKNAPVEGKVGIVTGGGSGHKPAFIGYIGENLCDAVAVGEIFSSPTAKAFLDAIKEADSGKGVACLYGNYAGDNMNVKMAMRKAKKLGIEATAKNINDLKLQKANEEKVAKEILEAAKAFAEDIKEKSVTVTIKTGEGGKTFGSVSSKEIAAAYKSQLNIEIDKKKLQLAEPVRSLGVYKVPYKVHPKVTAELTVKVAEA